MLEQVATAALDCYRLPLAEYCLEVLKKEFPESLRIHKIYAMHLEALEMQVLYILQKEKNCKTLNKIFKV